MTGSTCASTHNSIHPKCHKRLLKFNFLSYKKKYKFVISLNKDSINSSLVTVSITA